MKIAVTVILASVCWMACSPSEPATPEPLVQSTDDDTKVELLFVQDAKGVEFVEDSMTLKGINPTTVYFSDRPARIAGRVEVASLLATLEEHGEFAAVNPNATLVTLEGERLQDVVMVLRAKPELAGEDLIFPEIEILEGSPGNVKGVSSLFIDAFGRPARWHRPGNPRGAGDPRGRFDPRGPGDPRGGFGDRDDREDRRDDAQDNREDRRDDAQDNREDRRDDAQDNRQDRRDN